MSLKKQSDFKRLAMHGHTFKGKYVVVKFLPGLEDRYAVVASRRVGGAVQRNRAKRRMRALWRIYGICALPKADVVMYAQASLVSGVFDDIKAEYKRVQKYMARMLLEPPCDKE